jgi:hypothetical protein
MQFFDDTFSLCDNFLCGRNFAHTAIMAAYDAIPVT